MDGMLVLYIGSCIVAFPLIILLKRLVTKQVTLLDILVVLLLSVIPFLNVAGSILGLLTLFVNWAAESLPIQKRESKLNRKIF